MSTPWHGSTLELASNYWVNLGGGRVSKALIERWSVQSRPTKTVVQTWETRSRVMASLAEAWDVRTRVSFSVDSSWGTGAHVQVLLVETWDTQIVLTRVDATLDESWDVADPTAGPGASWDTATEVVIDDTNSFDPASTSPGTEAPYFRAYWTFTPTESGMLNLDTLGAAVTDPDHADTQIRVYRGGASEADGTNFAGSNDDYGGGSLSRLSIPVVPGETYRIVVGTSGDDGSSYITDYNLATSFKASTVNQYEVLSEVLSPGWVDSPGIPMDDYGTQRAPDLMVPLLNDRFFVLYFKDDDVLTGGSADIYTYGVIITASATGWEQSAPFAIEGVFNSEGGNLLNEGNIVGATVAENRIALFGSNRDLLVPSVALVDVSETGLTLLDQVDLTHYGEFGDSGFGVPHTLFYRDGELITFAPGRDSDDIRTPLAWIGKLSVSGDTLSITSEVTLALDNPGDPDLVSPPFGNTAWAILTDPVLIGDGQLLIFCAYPVLNQAFVGHPEYGTPGPSAAVPYLKIFDISTMAVTNSQVINDGYYSNYFSPSGVTMDDGSAFVYLSMSGIPVTGSANSADYTDLGWIANVTSSLAISRYDGSQWPTRLDMQAWMNDQQGPWVNPNEIAEHPTNAFQSLGDFWMKHFSETHIACAAVLENEDLNDNELAVMFWNLDKARVDSWAIIKADREQPGTDEDFYLFDESIGNWQLQVTSAGILGMVAEYHQETFDGSAYTEDMYLALVVSVAPSITSVLGPERTRFS